MATWGEFADWLKGQEQWRPEVYDDVGKPAIGWGHRLLPGESYGEPITEQHGNELLYNDMVKAMDAARRTSATMGHDFDALPIDAQQKLTERAFNVGPSFGGEFPKWTTAVLSGDTETELAEHHRSYTDKYGEKVLMDTRNRAYESFFHEPGREPATREATTDGGVAPSPNMESGGDAGEAGTPPSPATMDDLMADSHFRALPPAEQSAKLAEVSPMFARYYQEEPEAATAWAQGQIEKADPDIWSSLEGGWDTGIGMMQLAAANAAMLVEEMGVENDFDESWMAAAEMNFITGEAKIGSDWYDQVAAIMGGLPGGLAIPGAATAALTYGLPVLGLSAGATAFVAPSAAFGTYGALSAAHEGPEAALQRGAIDAALGATFPLTMHLGAPLRMGIEGGLAYAVSEQDDETRRMIEAATIGTIAGVGRRRAPHGVWKKLGFDVKDKSKGGDFGRQVEALEDAKRVREANEASTDASQMSFLDEEGNLVPLADAQKRVSEGVQSEGPYTMQDAERPAHQQAKIRNAAIDTRNDNRPIQMADGPESKSLEFNPGENYRANRTFELDGEVVEPVMGKKFIKAGDVITKLLKAFEIPSHRGARTREARGQAGRLGWFNPWNRRMHTQTRTDIQTTAHEAGHDISFFDPELKKMHMGEKFVDDMGRIDEIADRVYANEPPMNMHDAPAISHTGKRMTLAGRTPVNKIDQLWKDGHLPEDLRYIPELLSISYDRNLVYEGVAESFRAWTTNNKKYGGAVDLAETLPQTNKMLEAWKAQLPRSKRRALEAFQRDAHAHLAQHALVAGMSRYGADADPAKVLSDNLQQYRMAYTDDLSGLYNAEVIEYGRVVPDGPYMQARLLRGSGDAADRLMYNGYAVLVPDGDRKINGKQKYMIEYHGEGIADIFKRHKIRSKRMLNRAMHYVTMRQANELKNQIRMTDRSGKTRTYEAGELSPRQRAIAESSNTTRERLFSREEIEAGLRLADNHPEFKALFNDLHNFANKMADFGEAAGLWNRKQRDAWMRHEFVYSFFRDMSDQAGKRSQWKPPDGKPTRTLYGSDRNLRDPLQNLIDTHARTFKLATENLAQQKVISFIEQAQGGGRFGEFAKRIKKVKTFDTETIKAAYVTELKKRFPIPEWTHQKYVEHVDALFAGIDARGLERVNLFLGMDNPQGNNIITTYVRGEPVHYQIDDPMMYRSIQNFRRPALFGVEKHWNALRRLKQHFITMAPGFIAANFARDVAMASILSKTGHFHLGKAVGGLWSAITKDKQYQEYMANGGGAAGIRESLGSQRRKLIRHAQRTGFNPKRLLLDAVSVHRALDELSRATELASRLGEYKAARKQGASARHAAYMGREVSTDFGMRGENSSMNFMANIIPFFNAMVQGSDKMYRATWLDPMRERIAAGTKIAAVAGAGVALYALNRQVPQYMDLPDWDKWGYWHFFIPKWDENGERQKVTDPESRFVGQLDYTHLKMPKLWEVGTISTVFERMMQFMLDDEDPEVVELGKDSLHLIAMNFGLNLFDRAFPLPMPAGIDIAVEQFSNRVLFTGNPIESQAMANLESWRKRRPDQAKVFGEYGKLMQDVPGVPDSVKSPARAEAFLRGIFGEFTMMGAALADSVLYPGGPSRRMDQYPVISRFYEGPEKYSRMEGEFYEMYTSLRQAEATKRKMASNPAELDQLQDWLSKPENIDRLGLEGTFERQQNILADLEAYISMVEEGGMGLSPAEARAEIDRVTQLKRQIMEATNRVARDLGVKP